MERRHAGTDVGVALVGADDEPARLGHGEVGAGHPGVGRHEAGPGVLAHRLGQVVRVGVRRVRAEVPGEEGRHVGPELVDGRHHDVARRLAVELLDALAQVRLGHLDPALLEVGRHAALLLEHRLALGQGLDTVRMQDVVDHRVVLLGVPGPVDVRAELRRVGLELFEVPVQVRERVLLDLRGQLAQLLPLRNAGDRHVAVVAHPPDEAVVSGLVRLVGDEPGGQPFRIDGTGHSGPPLRIWATWMTFIGSFRRSITPFWWSRQDMSAEAMYSAPWRWKSLTRS